MWLVIEICIWTATYFFLLCLTRISRKTFLLLGNSWGRPAPYRPTCHAPGCQEICSFALNRYLALFNFMHGRGTSSQRVWPQSVNIFANFDVASTFYKFMPSAAFEESIRIFFLAIGVITTTWISAEWARYSWVGAKFVVRTLACVTAESCSCVLCDISCLMGTGAA